MCRVSLLLCCDNLGHRIGGDRFACTTVDILHRSPRRQGEDLHRLRSDGRPDQGATWGEKPKLVFQFEYATRGKMMFRVQEKLQLLKRFRRSLDPGAPWAGFYTAGEIGPVEEHNLRHLYTSVVLALS